MIGVFMQVSAATIRLTSLDFSVSLALMLDEEGISLSLGLL